MAATKKKPSTKRNTRKNAVEVKSYKDVLAVVNRFIAKNLHDRYSVRFAESTRQKIVSYGPWLTLATLIFVAPELLVLANNAMLISPIGFLEKVLFNRESWVLLIIVFINILCSVDALTDLFEKNKRGWNRVYAALLINLGYVLYQLFTNLEQPAAPLLSALGFIFCIFAVLDIREYYK